MLARFLTWLSDRADRITDQRLMTIVLAFVAGGLCVSVASATALAVGEGAARWDWLFWADNLFQWLDGFAQNFSTEMIGAAITFVLLEVMLARRRDKEAEEREKERLILQMGSPFHESAVEASRQLAKRGWLSDGSLNGADLGETNLQGADLRAANLQQANFWGANLEGAYLNDANLQQANINDSNLRGADLSDARMRKANLLNANLQGTTLNDVNLQGAKLREAKFQGARGDNVDLQGADLRKANLQLVILVGANLQGSDLAKANMHEADLEQANLQVAKHLARHQLREAKSLRGATLPDGTKLPDDDTWREVFEAWCETVAVDEDGYIIPADLADDTTDH